MPSSSNTRKFITSILQILLLQVTTTYTHRTMRMGGQVEQLAFVWAIINCITLSGK